MGGVFTAVDPRGACHLDANRVTTLYSVDPKMDPKTMMHVWTARGFQGRIEEELVPGRVRSCVRPCGAVS